MSVQDWLGRLETGSVRRHYLVAMGVVVGALLVTAVFSAAAVIWASAMVRDHAQQTVQLHEANLAVMQSAMDAHLGLQSADSDQGQAQILYELPLSHLPSDQDRLAGLAVGHRRLVESVERQDAAIRAWMKQHATPVSEGAGAGAGTSAAGKDLFIEISNANVEVDDEIATVTGEINERTRSILLATLAVVVLLPLLAVALVAYIGGRLSRSVVEPLGGIARVLDELRSGREDARAVVNGPDEVRQIAAGLNLLTEENLRASEVEADVLIQLQTIDRVRTDLVSTVSHELRTPLASIKGYLELLQDELHDHMSPQQSSMMGVIRRNLDRLNELIANLLALSRAEETELAVEPVDLRTVATEVGTDLRLTAAGRDVAIRTLHSARPVTVLGDRSQLIRAVQNLVTNAVKFSRPGGTVELRVTQQGERAVLEVVDEGIGIPAADLPGLGSRFYRASNAVQAEIAGTGLGLRIVQTILERHGGDLSVESVEGEGATFTVRLPLSHHASEVFPELVVDDVIRERELSRD